MHGTAYQLTRFKPSAPFARSTKWSSCCRFHTREWEARKYRSRRSDESWAEDNEGSAALLRQHAARAGVTVSIDLPAADLPGKIALVATGHAIALVPGVLVSTLRADVTTLRLIDPPTRGIYVILPRDDQHPSAPRLISQLTRAFRLRPIA
jgi:hypothetical protein